MITDWAPLWISVKTSLLATVITFVVGILISYAMATYRGRWKGLVDGVFTLPLVLPPTVVGFFLLLICGKNGFVGKIFLTMDKNIIFSWSATVIAAVVVSFPMMYRGRTQTMPLAIFFAVEGGDMNKAMMWVIIIVLMSIAMILLLNYWSDIQQRIVGKRGR